MIRSVLIAGLICGIMSLSVRAGEPIVLDEVLAVLPHPEGDIVILASDIQLNLGGEQRSFRSVVLDGLMVLRARDMKLNVPEAAVDQFIAHLQKQNRCTLAELNEQFEMAGFSITEMREIIKNRRLVEELLSIVVRIAEPSPELVATYRTEHPVVQEESYLVRLGFVPRTDIFNKDALRSKLQQEPTCVEWDETVSYRARDLQPEQRALATMAVGDITIVAEYDEGFDVVQLQERTPRTEQPLDEATALYSLKEKLYLDALEEFQEKLIAQGVIRFCRDEEVLRNLLKKPLPEPTNKSG